MFSLMMADTGILPEVGEELSEFPTQAEARDAAWELSLEMGQPVTVCRGLPLSQNIVEVVCA